MTAAPWVTILVPLASRGALHLCSRGGGGQRMQLRVVEVPVCACKALARVQPNGHPCRVTWLAASAFLFMATPLGVTRFVALGGCGAHFSRMAHMDVCFSQQCVMQRCRSVASSLVASRGGIVAPKCQHCDFALRSRRIVSVARRLVGDSAITLARCRNVGRRRHISSGMMTRRGRR